jgi:hypothetical protein
MAERLVQMNLNQRRDISVSRLLMDNGILRRTLQEGGYAHKELYLCEEH